MRSGSLGLLEPGGPGCCFEGPGEVSGRSRLISFGAAGGLVVAGVACAVVVGGGLGQILALVLISLGLVAATSLVFYEVGLSEDRERAREEARARQRAAASLGRGEGRPRPRLERMRGVRRRLR